jgi:hypothetical protein
MNDQLSGGFEIPEWLRRQIADAQGETGPYAGGARVNPDIGNAFSRTAHGVAELTGVPSMFRGAENMAQFINDGDPIRGMGGAAQMAMGAMPGGAIFRGAKGLPGMGSAFGSFAVPAALGAATLPMMVGDAQAATGDKVSAAISSDLEVARHRAALEKAKAELTKLNGPGTNYASTAARQAAIAPTLAQIASLQGTSEKPGLIGQAEEIARKGYLENAPFRDRYPGAAESMFMGAGALAAGIPFVGAIRSNLTSRLMTEPSIMRSAKATEDAMRGSTSAPSAFGQWMGQKSSSTKPNESRFELERQTLNRKLDRYDRGGSSYLGNMAAGTGLMQEARMLPEEIDAVTFPYGHPTREAAVSALTSPGYYTSGAIPSILGGASAAAMGTKIGNLASKGSNPEIERARTLGTMDFGSRMPTQQGMPQASIMQRLSDRFLPASRPQSPSSSEGAQVSPPAPLVLPPLAPAIGSQPNPVSVQASPRSIYGGQQQAALRPHIRDEVASGRDVPTIDAANKYFQNIVPPMGGPFNGNLNDKLGNASSVVSTMRSHGVPDDQIARMLHEMMSKGGKMLPGIAGVGYGISAFNQQDHN